MTSSSNNQPWSLRVVSADDDAFWRRWQACLERHWGGHVFLDCRFLRTSVRHFSTGTLWLCQRGADDAEQVMLLLEQSKLGVFKTFSPPQSQIAPLIVAPGSASSLVEVFSVLPRICQRVDFYYVDPLFGQVPAAPREHMDMSPYGVTIAVSSHRPFADYWASRNKKLRDNIGRYLRRTQDSDGGMVFRVYRDEGAILEAFARYADLESRGWKEKAGTAINLGNAQGAFYADVLRAFMKNQCVLAFELWSDGVLIASRIAAIAGDSLVMLKTTFDENFTKLAPGRILLYLSLEAIFSEARVKNIEFYTNAQKEQLPWADSSREIANLSLYRHARVRRFAVLAGSLRARPNLSYALHRYDSFDSVPKAARALWKGASLNAAFSSPEWFENLYKHAGRSLGELAILCLLNKAEEALCIVPCVSIAAPRGGEDLFALANFYSPRFEVILNGTLLPTTEVLDRFLRALSLHSGWDSLSLFPLHRSDAAQALQSLAPGHLMHASAFYETANWHVSIADFAEYQSMRPACLRSTLRRKATKLQRAKASEFRILASPRDVAAAMDDFNKVYAASWKRAEPLPDFIGDMAEILANRRQLRLGLLYIEQEPVAGQIWVIEERVASIYKLAYREEFAHYSPGTLLTMHMLQNAVVVDHVTKVDYLTGDDAYKRDWMSTREEMIRLRITNLRRPRGIALAGYDHLREWKHRWEMSGTPHG